MAADAQADHGRPAGADIPVGQVVQDSRDVPADPVAVYRLEQLQATLPALGGGGQVKAVPVAVVEVRGD